MKPQLKVTVLVFEGLLLLSASVLASIRVQSPLGPDWTIDVVDAHAKAVAGVLVREELQNYSISGSAEEHDAWTDQQGRVHFPARTVTASLLTRGLGKIPSPTGFVHESRGIHDYVTAFQGSANASCVENGTVTEWTGEPSAVRCTLSFKTD